MNRSMYAKTYDVLSNVTKNGLVHESIWNHNKQNTKLDSNWFQKGSGKSNIDSVHRHWNNIWPAQPEAYSSEAEWGGGEGGGAYYERFFLEGGLFFDGFTSYDLFFETL